MKEKKGNNNTFSYDFTVCDSNNSVPYFSIFRGTMNPNYCCTLPIYNTNWTK